MGPGAREGSPAHRPAPRPFEVFGQLEQAVEIPVRIALRRGLKRKEEMRWFLQRDSGCKEAEPNSLIHHSYTIPPPFIKSKHP